MSVIAPPALDEVRAAAVRLEGVIVHTPLVSLHSFGESMDIKLKLETLQPVGSFKTRGIYHAVSRLSDDERLCGLSTVSAGNTAQALAWTALKFGVSARSIMPENAPQTKIDAVRAYGGEPILVSTAEVFRFLREREWEDEPYAFIHPWINREVMIGHGTMGLEVMADCPGVETVYIPVGGGGLMAGVGSTLRALKPSLRIIGVEPMGCPSLSESIRLGKPVSVPCETICDGVAVPYMTDELFPLLRDLVDEVALISEGAVKKMVRRLALHNKIIAEPSAALAAAAALATPKDERGLSVCIFTGGSIDPVKLADILTGPE